MIKCIKPRTWVCASCRRQTGHLQQRRRLSTASGAASADARLPPVDHSASGRQHSDSLLRQIFDAGSPWRALPKTNAGVSNAGLFRNAYLTTPAGFLVYARTSLAKAQEIVDKVLNASSLPEYRAIVRDLDRLSDLLCRVIDLCDFVQVTHPDRRVQRAASEAWSIMYQYMNQLNTTTGLNDQLDRAMANPEVTGFWTEEEKSVAETLKLDFAKSAVNLPRESRDRFVDLSQRISEVGPAFVNDMAPHQAQVALPSSQFLGMDPVAAARFTRRGVVYLPSVGPEATMALRSVYDESTRKALYCAMRT